MSRGVYRIDGLTAGEFVVRVERLGYVTWEGRVVVVPGESARLSVTLEVAPLVLDTIAGAAAGAARPAVPYLGGFWERRERGIGYYFTRADMDRERPNRK